MENVIDQNLVEAQKIVDYLFDRCQEVVGDPLCPTLTYSTYTLSIEIDNVILWDSESCDKDEFTAEACWEKYMTYIGNVAKLLPQ